MIKHFKLKNYNVFCKPTYTTTNVDVGTLRWSFEFPSGNMVRLNKAFIWSTDSMRKTDIYQYLK